MKIIHVISGLTKGGGERVVVELANKAAEKGDDVTILAAWPVNPEFLQDQISDAVQIKFVGGGRKAAYLKIVPWIIANRKWICSHDVLHCHLTFGALFGTCTKLLLRTILRKKTPVVVETYHAVGMPIPDFNRWVHAKMILVKDGLVLMAKDPYWKNFVDQHPKLENDLIPNGIAVVTPEKNEGKRQQYKKQTGVPNEAKFIVGTVSMLRPDRRPELYIPICKKVNETFGSEACFVLGGDGIEMKNLKALVKENKLAEAFYLPGLVINAASVIVNFDMYVSVSVGKTTGISMIEAAMCKVPVVGIQLIEDYTATDEDWVWSHTSLDEVAKKITHLLQNENERQALAQKQYDYVASHFTSDAMYASYDRFYKKIISQKNTAR